MGWAVLSPLATKKGWVTVPVRDMAIGARGWILWVALAIMCTDALVSLLPVFLKICWDTFLRQHNSPFDFPLKESESEDRLVPNTWVMGGLVFSTACGTLLVWLIFGSEGIKPWATFLGFVLGGMLSIIGLVTIVLLVIINAHKICQSACAWRN